MFFASPNSPRRATRLLAMALCLTAALGAHALAAPARGRPCPDLRTASGWQAHNVRAVGVPCVTARRKLSGWLARGPRSLPHNRRRWHALKRRGLLTVTFGERTREIIFTLRDLHPAITIAAPTDGARYAPGRRVRVRFSCAARRGRLVRCHGTPRNRMLLDTARRGAHTFTVTAKERAGRTTLSARRTVRYTVGPPTCAANPTIELQPGPQTVGAPTATSFTAQAANTDPNCHRLNVRWQYSTDAGGSWQNDTTDPGERTTTLTIASTTAAASGRQYRAAFTNEHGTTHTSAATLTVRETIVTLTFDDSLADQYTAGLPLLQQYAMTGTFYVITGKVSSSDPKYMTWQQVRVLAAAGNEIGAHTVLHADLPELTASEQQRELCESRNTLLAQGFAVTDFAYPYGAGAGNSALEALVSRCGYDSARSVTGIGCPTCRYAESLTPADPYNLAVPVSVRSTTTPQAIESWVSGAQQHAGGWLILTFHHICENACNPYAITPEDFGSVLAWLKAQAAAGNVRIRTVQQVIGGAVKPAVSAPVQAAAPYAQNPSFETLDPYSGEPACYFLNPYGHSTAFFAQTADAHTGAHGGQLSVTGAQGLAGAGILTTMDLGQCAPTLKTGESYTVSAYYHSTAPVFFDLFVRDQSGGWGHWMHGPPLPASTTWTHASFTTPPLPAGDDGLSFGLNLPSVGTLSVDDYALTPTG
jgi:peptidoglycan/xylan/chitin deacetylase (PgdA/CDA1 family)